MKKDKFINTLVKCICTFGIFFVVVYLWGKIIAKKEEIANEDY